MIRIVRLHHYSVLVQDLQRALDFYTGLLGLRVNQSRPQLGYPGAWLDVGDCQIHLMQLPVSPTNNQPVPHGGRDRHIALEVVEIEALKMALEHAAIPYTVSKSGRQALFCRDPDGNAIEFLMPPASSKDSG